MLNVLGNSVQPSVSICNRGLVLGYQSAVQRLSDITGLITDLLSCCTLNVEMFKLELVRMV